MLISTINALFRVGYSTYLEIILALNVALAAELELTNTSRRSYFLPYNYTGLQNIASAK